MVNKVKTKSATKHVGTLTIKPANSWIDESVKNPDPKRYFNDLIVQFENTVIFAATNVGKSILATQICEDIAQTEKVLYVDLELSGKQFQLRYTDTETGKVYRFSPNLERAEITPENMMGTDPGKAILDSIEEAAKQGTKFFVIDNLTCVCNNIERGKQAGDFMQRLIMLKKKYGITTVVIAHTPKRKSRGNITQADLAGASKLINLFDEGIALARSAKDDNLRYLKQVKVRTGECKYGDDNVLLLDLSKENGFLRFEVIGVGCEDEHLNMFEDENEEDKLMTILSLHKEGKTVREIAAIVGLGKSTVQRRLEYAKKANISIPEESEKSVHFVPAGTMGQANGRTYVA